jgi:alpha-amylase
MNKYLLLLIIFLTGSAANAKHVKFAVDMTGQAVNTTGIHVSGDFQEAAGYPGGNWQSNTTVMTNEPGTEIYSVIVNIPAFAKYEYKFLNGDQWYEVEFVPVESRVGYNYNDNRWIYIDSLYNDTTMISPVLFSGNAPAGQHLLRLKADLQLEPSVSADGVHVAGDFQGWDPSQTIMYSFEEKVFEYIAYVDISTGYAEYRFVNGNSAAGYETVPAECSVAGNRAVTILHDTVAGPVCFSSCIACSPQGLTESLQTAIAIIYPNPLTTSSILEFNDNLATHNVAIIDLTGKMVRIYKDCSVKALEINRENLKKGIYFVRVSNHERWLCTLRLVISN